MGITKPKANKWRNLYLIRRRENQTFAVKFLQVLREENEHVNWLAKSISTGHITVDWQDLCFVQQSFAIEELEMQMIPKGTDWTTPIIFYLKNGTLPEDHDESRRLKVWAVRFMLIVDVLYSRGFSRPYLRCLIPDEADYVIREVHEGVCGSHIGVWSLVHKLIWAGYYWPTM